MRRSAPGRASDAFAIRRLGRKGREWARVRRQLKCEFVGRGITTCELRLPGCLIDNQLSFAHRYKRRHIATLEELRVVILCCVPCHNVIELNGEAKMCRIVNSVIAGRSKAS